MKIVLATTIYEEAGGTKNLIDDMSKKFRELGHAVATISVYPRYEKGILFQGPLKDITYLNKTDDINILNSITKFVDFVEKEKPDRIYFFLGHGIQLLLASALRDIYKSKSILFFLDPWFTIPELKDELEKYSSKFKQIREKLASLDSTVYLWKKARTFELLAGHDSQNTDLYKSVKTILLCTDDMIEYFTKSLGVPSEKIKYLPLYTRSLMVSQNDISDLKTPKTRQQKDMQKIIFMGRVSSSWKGFWLILDTMKNIKNLKLDIYTVSPSEVDLAQKLFEKYKIDYNSRVNFYLGKRDVEVFNAMKQSDILILPSLAEGFSFVVVECMGVGGIVVAGPIYGGPLEIITSGINGFLYKGGSSKSLITTIKKIVKMDETNLNIIRENAKKRAREYSFELFWKRLSEGENF